MTTMSNNQIAVAFSMLIEEYERAIHETNKLGGLAFAEKKYDLVPSITEKAKGLEAFQGKVVALEEEWAASEESAKDEKKKGKWKKQSPGYSGCVSFHLPSTRIGTFAQRISEANTVIFYQQGSGYFSCMHGVTRTRQWVAKILLVWVSPLSG